MSLEQLHQVVFKFLDSVPENHSGTDLISIVVNQKGRDSKGSHRQPRFRIDVVKVVIHIPVNCHIGDHIDFGIVKLCNFRQVHTGTVGLHSISQHIIHIINKKLYRYSLICVIARYVQPRKGYELDFRVIL